ncbi:MAG: hypothetical protein QXU20_02510, partial [Candidatus Woesearchaeota archaeon]
MKKSKLFVASKYVLFVVFVTLFLSGCVSMNRKEIEISGKVTDNINKPLEGVLIKALTPEGEFKTVTDKDGKYNLQMIVSEINIKKLKISTAKKGEQEEASVELGEKIGNLEEGGYIVEFHLYYEPFGYYTFPKLVNEGKNVDFQLDPRLADSTEKIEIKNFEEKLKKLDTETNFTEEENDFNLGEDAPNSTINAVLIKPGKYTNTIFSYTDQDAAKINFEPGDIIKIKISNLNPNFEAPQIKFYNSNQNQIYLGSIIRKQGNEVEYYYSTDSTSNEREIYLLIGGIRSKYLIDVKIELQKDLGQKGDAPKNQIEAESKGFYISGENKLSGTLFGNDDRDCFVFDFSEGIYNISIIPNEDLTISVDVFDSNLKGLDMNSCLKEGKTYGQKLNL